MGTVQTKATCSVKEGQNQPLPLEARNLDFVVLFIIVNVISQFEFGFLNSNFDITELLFLFLK
jgi:hypothetical protein